MKQNTETDCRKKSEEMVNRLKSGEFDGELTEIFIGSRLNKKEQKRSDISIYDIRKWLDEAVKTG
jgi:hypothetical protein